ncbi:MAG: hypothetical protein IPM60_05715 [Rhodospirillales bacterium]|nr:hypothetical protein [Rhodospirillales bacterium]
MEQQFSNPYGLLAAARPDTIAALYAISKRPLLGFGSTNVDSNVYDFWVDVSTASYLGQDNYYSLMQNHQARQWELGTPSHSHLFGAWADAGILAALCWFAVLGLSIYVLARSMLWRNPYAPLFVYITLDTIWNVLFSPGPHRMDVALHLMVLVYAAEALRSFDVRAIAATAMSPTRGFTSAGNFVRPLR